MLQVTDDGSYLQYPVGRHLEFQYSGIVSAMQPVPVPPPPPAVQQAISDAQNVLYTMDTTDPDNPVIQEPSPLYKKYKKNALAYANAKANYAVQMEKTLADPTTANIWPQISAPLQEAVDDAWDTWKTEGADKIERALAVVESQGINMQQAQIAKAKKQLDIWSLGLAGVPTDIPYSYVEPSEWADPTVDDIGFEQLTIKRTSESHTVSTVTDSNRSFYWNNQQTSTSQSAHGGFFGIGASEASSNADQHSANGDASSYKFQQNMSNEFSDLEIDLEWALVNFQRPWLISDLFYMNNWYIQGQRANCISDGKIETQLRSNGPLLPMIPQEALVIRNVSVKSSSWGDNTAILNRLYNSDQASSDASQSSAGGNVDGIGFGPISFGGGAQHTDNKAQGQGSGYSAGNAVSNRNASFDGTTLTINGAQIIAFLSDIVPPSPAMDDPALPKLKTAPASAGPAASAAR